MIGKRRLSEVIAAIFQHQHYRALANMWRFYPDFLDSFWRYASGNGVYPFEIKVRTPVGIVGIELHSYHDILTVNEIFCRHDYPAETDVRYVVDIGSNIGISAIFFLTRNSQSKCMLYEPDPRNAEKLKKNLVAFEDRYTLIESAVSDHSGKVEFGIESTGRYGGMNRQSQERIIVHCLHIEEALREALRAFPHIDVLKIDTEGEELKTFAAIDASLLQRIKRIYLEANPQEALQSDLFTNKQYGSVRQLICRRDWSA
jgi:FkbM family methyltransferase